MQVTDYTSGGKDGKPHLVIIIHQSISECKRILSQCRGIVLNVTNPDIRICKHSDEPYARITIPLEMAHSTTEFTTFLYNLSRSERHGYVEDRQ